LRYTWCLTAGLSFVALATATGAAGIAGVYTGTYVCPEKTPLRLTLTLQPDGTLAGIFAFRPRANRLGVTEEAYNLRGTYEQSTGRFRLKAVSWVAPAPVRALSPAIEGAYDASTDSLTARFTGLRCGDFEIARDAATAGLERRNRPIDQLGDVPASAAVSGKPPESCAAILRWSSRFDREYENTNWRNMPVDAVIPKMVNQFADDDFVPYFGKPLDQMTQEERLRIARTMRECQDLPQFGQFSRGILPGLRNQFALPAPPALARMGERRKVREELRRTMDQLAGLPPTADSFSQVPAIEANGKKAFAVLWPSELKSFETAVAASRQRMAEPLLSQKVTAAIAGAGTRDAVLKLDQVAVENRALFAAVGPEAARRENDRLAGALRQGLERLMSEERRRIDSFGSGLAAVEAGARWHREFSAAYSKVLNDESVRATLAHFADRRERDLRASSAQLAADIRKTANDRELGVLAVRYTSAADRNGPAGSALLGAVAEQEKKFAAEALAKIIAAEPKRDPAPSMPNKPTKTASSDFSDYNAPGILRAVFGGRFESVADDTLTRDYLLSVKAGINGPCQDLADRGTVALIDYGMYYEAKALRKGSEAAFAGNIGQAMQQLLGNAPIGRAGGMVAVIEHLIPEGEEDGRKLVSRGCGWKDLLTLHQNMIDLARERGTIPPEFADNEHFVAQLKPELSARFLRFRAVENPVLARSLKRSCGVYIRNAAMPKDAEGYCRCEVKMMLDSRVPQSSLQRLLPANMTRETLHELEVRYPEYERLAKQCFN
jgi:hypothetical protein